MVFSAEFLGRFWKSVEKTTDEDSCWLWTGYLKNGYGAISLEGKMLYTHHVSYEIHYGERSDLFVLPCLSG